MIRILAALLILQAGAAAFLYWPENRQAEAPTALISSLAYPDVERIVVTDAEGGEATLTLTDGNWSINGSLPADRDKTDTLLASLLTSDPGLAIATSEGAAKRFRVTEDDFERRISLHTDSGEATVYLGSSPSFRKIHARRQNANDVYVVELNSYDAPSDTQSWLDGPFSPCAR